MARSKPSRAAKTRASTAAPPAPKTRASTAAPSAPKTRTRVVTPPTPKPRRSTPTPLVPKVRATTSAPPTPKKRRSPTRKPTTTRAGVRSLLAAEPTAGTPPPGPTQSVSIQKVNGAPFDPSANYPRNQQLVVEGTATVSFDFLTGRIDPPSSPMSFPNVGSGPSTIGWQLTWPANTIPNPGQDLLTVSVVGGSASDALLITFA